MEKRIFLPGDLLTGCTAADDDDDGGGGAGVGTVFSLSEIQP